MKANYDFSKGIKNPYVGRLKRNKMQSRYATPAPKNLLRILESGGERAAHEFLKRYPFLLQIAFSRSWNANICIPEFRLGENFKTDFLVLSANSGMWQAALIELKSPSAKLYNKDGTPLKALRIARKQLEDYQDWIRRNESYLRQALAKILRERKHPAMCSSADLHTWGETEIVDPHTYIRFKYHILIGRRKALTDEERRRRANEFMFHGSPEIVTYDRLVDIAWFRAQIKKGQVI